MVFKTLLRTCFAVVAVSQASHALNCQDLFRDGATRSSHALEPIPQKGPQFHAHALTKASEVRTSRIKEFEMIRDVASRLGVRVWLWGQSASSYSGFVLRVLGTERDALQGKFDFLEMYDYSMPLQLTIDGPAPMAKLVEQELQSLFSKSTSVNSRLLSVQSLEVSHRPNTASTVEIDPQNLVGLPAALRAKIASSQNTEATLIEAVEILAPSSSSLARNKSTETKFLREKEMGRVNAFELSADFSNADLPMSSRLLSREAKTPRTNEEIKAQDVFNSVAALRDSVHGEDRIQYIETIGPIFDFVRSQNLVDGHNHKRYLLRTLIHTISSPRLRKAAAVEFLMSSSPSPLISLLKLKDYVSATEYSEILIDMKLWRENANSRKRLFIQNLDLVKARADRRTMIDFERAGLPTGVI